MKIDFHPPKWLMYVVIVLFSCVFGFGLMKVIGDAVNQHANKKIEKYEESALQNKQLADSVALIADMQMDSVIEKIKTDSIRKDKADKSFRLKQVQIIKGYEAKVARIDTMPADELDSYVSRRLREEDNNW